MRRQMQHARRLHRLQLRLTRLRPQPQDAIFTQHLRDPARLRFRTRERWELAPAIVAASRVKRLALSGRCRLHPCRCA
jgi:hypothetical protein